MRLVFDDVDSAQIYYISNHFHRFDHYNKIITRSHNEELKAYILDFKCTNFRWFINAID